MSRYALVVATIALFAPISGCAKKPEAAAAPEAPLHQLIADVVCSYAPSQSAVVSYIAGAGDGGIITAKAIAKAAGLTAVRHSSGSYIFTGPGGYLAGTLGIAITEPVVVGVGIAIGAVATTIELLCVPRNHPEMVERVESTAREFLNRAASSARSAAQTTKPVVAKINGKVMKAGNDAFAYASRKSVKVSEALRRLGDGDG